MINNVLICGTGAVGSIFADKIQKSGATLKVLVDDARLEKYKKTPPVLNGKALDLDYILPGGSFDADLIIIATKFTGLAEAVDNIANFVRGEHNSAGENTIIISLLNGITSEEIIAERYGAEHVEKVYFIGHSAMRVGVDVTSGENNTIVFGGNSRLKEFFDRAGIDYQVHEDIERSMWRKLILNIAVNQLSAIFKMTFGQIVRNRKFLELSKLLMDETALVAQAAGIADAKTLADEAFVQLSTVASPEGKTSMLQDVEAKRKTEVEIFSGTIVDLGKKYNIPTPYNKIVKEMVEVMEAEYENS